MSQTNTDRSASATSQVSIEIASNSTEKAPHMAELKEPIKPATAQNKEEKKPAGPVKTVPFSQLFRFATPFDKLLMVVGTIGSIMVGLALPMFSIVFGDLINALSGSSDTISERVAYESLYFCVIGVGAFIGGVLGMGSWYYTAHRQSKRLREEFLRSVLRQDIAWFDTKKALEISSQLSSETSDIETVIGEKMQNFLQYFATFWGGLIVGLARGYQLALVVLGVTPLMGISLGAFGKILMEYSKKAQEAYSKAGGIAEETLAGVRTVQAFSAQARQETAYAEQLGTAEKTGVRKGLLQGLTMASASLFVFSAYGLCLWFGGWLIRDHQTNNWTGNDYNGGDVLTVFFSVLLGAQAVGLAGPAIESFSTGRAAAFRLYEIIDRASPIDPLATTGRRLSQMLGNITFDGITFAYPSRLEFPIFSNFNLQIQAGKRTAIVGPSGSGKSTVISLIERFYDPQSGSIKVDGVDLKDLNIKWWRERIGLVSQEPVLFDGTIRENIVYGRKRATEEEILSAAKAANAHDFILRLPNGYDTSVGEGGATLSGGQKQRIAIARAMLRDPKILLLDEATSALDNENERLVQEALEKVMVNRTTVIIAHRLSTIVNADVICVFSDGRIVERGNHQQLMALNGLYANLVRVQQLSSSDHGQTGPTIALPTTELARGASGSLTSAKDRYSERPSDRAGVGSLKLGKTVVEDQKEDQIKEQEKYPPVPNMRVWLLVKDYWYMLALGAIGSTMTGVYLPLFGLIFGNFAAIFYESDSQMEHDTANYAIYFFLLGLGLFIAEILRNGAFSYVGEKLTRRLRTQTFHALLRQDIGWFDLPTHNSHILTNRLQADAALVHGAATGPASVVCQIIAATVTGFTIAFIYGWQLTLVVLGCAPFLFIAARFQMRIFTGLAKAGKTESEKAIQLSGESIANMRTLASSTAEDYTVQRFAASLEKPLLAARKTGQAAGVALGFSQAVIYFAYALCFWVGAKLVEQGDMNWSDVIKVVFAIVFFAMCAGQATQMAPDFAKASQARDQVFAVIDRVPSIDSDNVAGSKPVLPSGAVRFDKVDFSYPSRPGIQVLKQFDLRINAGETLGVVGVSGSGKSTLVSLLLRFYDPQAGTITIDDCNIREMNLNTLRAQIGLVAQEPRLFDATIKENIAIGNPEATDEEIFDAAKQANIHEAILAFPDGYNTPVGPKGEKLSGGEKQRVAIARALVRNPKVLLLDEATSALDTKSERLVLEKLMAARKRTTVVIAHRLSTLTNADHIAVIDSGQVKEFGTHQQLMELGGVYASLAKARAES